LCVSAKTKIRKCPLDSSRMSSDGNLDVPLIHTNNPSRLPERDGCAAGDANNIIGKRNRPDAESCAKFRSLPPCLESLARMERAKPYHR
jgi:hypothetical protein